MLFSSIQIVDGIGKDAPAEHEDDPGDKVFKADMITDRFPFARTPQTTQNSQLPLSLVPTMDGIGKEARDVRKEDQPDKLRMISLTDSESQQLQKVQYSTRTTQNSQLLLSPVSIVDRIGKEARIVHEYVCVDKLFLVSLPSPYCNDYNRYQYSPCTMQN